MAYYNKILMQKFIIYFLSLLLAFVFFVPNNKVQAQTKQYFTNEIVIQYQDGIIEKVAVQGDIYAEIEQYEKDPNVKFAEPNYKYFQTAMYNPNDTDLFNQTYLNQINIPEAWEITNGSDEVVIGVIDSGTDIDHPDLVNKIWVNEDEIPDDRIDNDRNGYVDDYYGWDFIDNDNDPNPDFDTFYTEDGIAHGTIVAGIAGAETDNAFGMASVGWNTKIMAIRSLDSIGEGELDTLGIAINYAVAQGVDILNLSFVGSGDSKILRDSIINAYNQGVIVIAAAGNTSDLMGGNNLNLTPMYPVCYDFDGVNMVLGVAAVDAYDQKAAFSNYGMNCVDLTAPGEDIYSTLPYNPAEDYIEYFTSGWSGTSMATPLVAGTAALIKSINKDFTNDEVYDFILSNTKDIYDLNPYYYYELGTGRLDAGVAVFAAQMYNQGGSINIPPEPEPEVPVEVGEPELIVAAASDYSPEVRIFDAQGQMVNSFLAYASTFNKGVNVAVGDVNGDGKEDIITGVGYGGGPHVRVFDFEGNVISQFFAYDEKFRGGVRIATGDLDNDGIDEIITTPGSTGGPHVKVFDSFGNVKLQFFATDEFYANGITVASGNVQADNADEIIVGMGSGTEPKIKVFDRYGNLVNEFLGYAQTFDKGIYVRAGNVDGAGYDEIIIGSQNGGGPQVRVFDFTGSVISQFFAYDEKFRGGVFVGAQDLGGDGIDEIITGAGIGGGPHIRVFDKGGQVKLQFFAFEESFRGGVNVY